MQDITRKALFITDKAYVDYEIAGGVQLCTTEFITYFEAAGYAVDIFKVAPVITLIKRAKIKLGMGAYNLYDVAPYLNNIITHVKTNNIKLILFNQVNLAHWVTDLKMRVPTDVKFICLSHGNESGDYLHEITQKPKTSFLHILQLGKLLVHEKQVFDNLDGVITISQHEAHINNWIGAKQILYLPRILNPAFIDWQQSNKRVGFVGTLDHLPNIAGIKLLAAELKKNNFSAEFAVAGGPEYIGHELERAFPFIKYKGKLTPDELISEAKTWTIFLNPVFWYARGSSTKLAQGINWGLPVITTPAGARGYELINQTIITETNTPAEFAQVVMKALNSPDYLAALKIAVEYNSSKFDISLWADKLRTFIGHIDAQKP